MPRAGELRHRVTILAATETTDAIGAVTQVWQPVGQIWCKITHDFRPVDNFNRLVQTMHYEDNTWFETRLTSAVTPLQRLQHGAVVYTVLTVRDETGENRATRIQARNAATP